MENRKNIDNLFKSELGSYTEAPPPAVWDALEKKLDNIPSTKPTPVFRWFGFLAALFIFVTVSVLVARNIAGDNNTTQQDVAMNIPAAGDHPAHNNNMANTPTGDNQPGADNISANASQPPAASSTETAAGNTPSAINQPVKYRSTNGTTVSNNINNPKTRTNTIAAKTGKKNNNKKTRTTRQQGSTYAAATGEETETSETQNVYNAANKQPIKQVTPENKKTDTVNEEKIAPPAPGQNTLAGKKNPPAKPHKPKFDRFEAGIKGGYEQSGTNDAAKSVLLSPYLQFKITPKLAIMLQPAIKYATVSSRQIGDAASYYKVNPDGAIKQKTDSAVAFIPGTSDSFWIWNYSYTESHDSIVKTNHTGAKYFEIETPILLKYYVAKDFAFYGGVNITYSKLTGITERTYTEKNLSRTITETGIGPVNAPAPQPQNLHIEYTSTPFSKYPGVQYPAPQGSQFRFGYMVGFSYEYEQRWLFDALVQQTFIKPNVQGNFNTYTPLSAPYIRLTIGYKLIK